LATKFGSDPEVQRTLIRATVLVFIVLIAGIIFMIWAGRSEEITRVGLLISQGIATLFNFWMINRSALTTNARVENLRQEVTERRAE
jgi:hypothetical protein